MTIFLAIFMAIFLPISMPMAMYCRVRVSSLLCCDVHLCVLRHDTCAHVTAEQGRALLYIATALVAGANGASLHVVTQCAEPIRYIFLIGISSFHRVCAIL